MLGYGQRPRLPGGVEPVAPCLPVTCSTQTDPDAMGIQGRERAKSRARAAALEIGLEDRAAAA